MYKIVCVFWLYEFFLTTSPMFAIFSAFMIESGLNPMMIAVCLSLFFATISLCELPSSLVADKYSRKIVLIVAGLFWFSGSAIMLFSHATFAFISCLMLCAVGSALKSGTVDAMLYDEMKVRNLEDKFPKAYGIYQSANLIGIATGLLISSFAVKYGYNTLVIIAICSTLISISIMLFIIKETPKIKLVTKQYSLRDIFAEAKHTVFHNPQVIYMSLIVSIYTGIVWSFGDTAIVTAMSLGWQKENIAQVCSILTFLNIAVLLIATKYITKFTVNVAHIILICVLLFTCVGMSFGSWLSIFCVFPIWWSASINDIAIRTRIQKEAVSSSRATTGSVISLITGVCYVISALLIGAIATQWRYSVSVTVVSGIAGLILTGLFFLHKKQVSMQVKNSSNSLKV